MEYGATMQQEADGFQRLCSALKSLALKHLLQSKSSKVSQKNSGMWGDLKQGDPCPSRECEWLPEQANTIDCWQTVEYKNTYRE